MCAHTIPVPISATNCYLPEAVFENWRATKKSRRNRWVRAEKLYARIAHADFGVRRFRLGNGGIVNPIDTPCYSSRESAARYPPMATLVLTCAAPFRAQ